MADGKRTSVKPTVLSEQFRRFSADTFGLRVNNNVAQLTFSLETADAEEREILFREATAVLTLQSLKVLQIVLTNTMEAIEKQFGPVALAPGKEEELKKVGQLFQGSYVLDDRPIMNDDQKRQAGGSPIDILVEEVTPAMLIEGLCVLEGWLDGDEDLAGLGPKSLVGMIYSRMRRAALEKPGPSGSAT